MNVARCVSSSGALEGPAVFRIKRCGMRGKGPALHIKGRGMRGFFFFFVCVSALLLGGPLGGEKNAVRVRKPAAGLPATSSTFTEAS